MACIYQIKNLVNNKIYIGSTIRPLYKRRYEHFSELKASKHCNLYLQNSFNKYGKENFILEILEEIYFPKNYTKILKSEYIVGRELYLVDLLKSNYNIKKDSGTGTSGYKHTEETRKKISESNMIKNPTEKQLLTRKYRENVKHYKLHPEDKIIKEKVIKEKREVIKKEKKENKTPWIKGSKHTFEAIEKIRQRSNQEDNKLRIRKIQKIAAQKRVGTNHSLESKLKMINTKFGETRIIEIYNLQKELLHSCIFSKEASSLTGIKRSAISNNLCGLSKTAGGYIFKYKTL
jgi:group I intron endonuclease